MPFENITYGLKIFNSLMKFLYKIFIYINVVLIILKNILIALPNFIAQNVYARNFPVPHERAGVH